MLSLASPFQVRVLRHACLMMIKHLLLYIEVLVHLLGIVVLDLVLKVVQQEHFWLV